jgi:Tfp pilus assembly protein PilE
MIALIIIIILLLIGITYATHRAYYLAGALADAQEYIEELELTNEYMYGRISDAYDNMKQIDHKGAFEAEDEAGTTFNMLLQTITELKETFDGEEKEEK